MFLLMHRTTLQARYVSYLTIKFHPTSFPRICWLLHYPLLSFVRMSCPKYRGNQPLSVNLTIWVTVATYFRRYPFNTRQSSGFCKSVYSVFHIGCWKNWKLVTSFAIYLNYAKMFRKLFFKNIACLNQRGPVAYYSIVIFEGSSDLNLLKLIKCYHTSCDGWRSSICSMSLFILLVIIQFDQVARSG